jgi:hypothetical protein
MSYVYRQIHKQHAPDLFTVGHYDPDGKFVPQSDYHTEQSAADRVHYLNGGDVVRSRQDLIDLVEKTVNAAITRHLNKEPHLYADGSNR